MPLIFSWDFHVRDYTELVFFSSAQVLISHMTCADGVKLTDWLQCACVQRSDWFIRILDFECFGGDLPKIRLFFCVDRPFRFRFRIRQFLLLPRAQRGKEVKKPLIITCRCKRELQHFKLSIMFSTVWTQRLGCKVTTSSNVHDDDLPPELKLSFVQSAFFLINRSFCSFVCFSRSFSYSLAFFLVRSFVLFYLFIFFCRLT